MCAPSVLSLHADLKKASKLSSKKHCIRPSRTQRAKSPGGSRRCSPRRRRRGLLCTPGTFGPGRCRRTRKTTTGAKWRPGAEAPTVCASLARLAQPRPAPR
eukprot:gene14043-biopygen18608